ncbi:glycosyltransferase [Rhizobium paknamense]|uniref:Glycosyltransferase involved in cell wall biosynthesis n=1 Tax=Rhizobium paknamense TaxID=1206817 RepID=A0ABU0ILF0_9HYPH|nr:glycosyltransferase [Rhizobium paknamense]MDQ0458004.1 glycosyltransferase involved in cell wall biosynthesis [Rhizobium paknamense]
MKVLFAGGHGYFPEINGGVESSTHHLVEQLRARGHEASVLACLFGDGFFGFKARAKLKLLRQPAVMDTYPGYPVMRAWFPWEAAGFAAQKMKPDVAVVQAHKSVPIAKALQAHNVPTVVYLRNVEFLDLAGDLREIPSALYIANSEFTAGAFHDKFGIESIVIPPTIDPKKYATPTTGDYVTFINPFDEKGVELALKLAAACPDIPFLFVESWKMSDSQRSALEKALSGLPNVRLEGRTNDMKTIYGRTKVLLAPSKWEEAWGRVASEAHCSGIPVLGSRRGGLPEAIGEGGVILDYDQPVEDWAKALQRLWKDGDYYASMSKAAHDFSRRPLLQPERQFELFMGVLEKAAGKTSRAPSLEPVAV